MSELANGLKMIVALRDAAGKGLGFSSTNQLVLGLCAHFQPGIGTPEMMKILPVTRVALGSMVENMKQRGVMKWEVTDHPTMKGRLLRRYYLTKEGEQRIREIVRLLE